MQFLTEKKSNFFVKMEICPICLELVLMKCPECRIDIVDNEFNINFERDILLRESLDEHESLFVGSFKRISKKITPFVNSSTKIIYDRFENKFPLLILAIFIIGLFEPQYINLLLTGNCIEGKFKILMGTVSNVTKNYPSVTYNYVINHTMYECEYNGTDFIGDSSPVKLYIDNNNMAECYTCNNPGKNNRLAFSYIQILSFFYLFCWVFQGMIKAIIFSILCVVMFSFEFICICFKFSYQICLKASSNNKQYQALNRNEIDTAV